MRLLERLEHAVKPLSIARRSSHLEGGSRGSGRQKMMWFAFMLAAAAAFPVTCEEALSELKMRPPAYGDKVRAELVLDMFADDCEAKMSGQGAVLSADDINAVTQLIQGRNDIMQR
jgi:hypothetical protein